MQPLAASGVGIANGAQGGAAGDPWKRAQAIVKRLRHPVRIRKADYTITDFGAKPCELVKVEGHVSRDERRMIDSPAADAFDCYAAIAKAIATCNAAGGGRVVLPKGNWFCAGPVVLLSNVNVHLNAGAQLFFSKDPADFAKYGSFDCGKNGKLERARWQSNDCLNYSPLIYAYGQYNIALTGDDWTAILDGQGGNWWAWAQSPNITGSGQTQHQENPLNAESLASVAPDLAPAMQRMIEGDGTNWRTDHQYLSALSEADVPVARRIFGIGHFLRPPMIQFIGCTNVLMQGYQLRHSPFWQHHPVNCRNVVIRKVHANSLGPNSDGINPDACNGVLIEGCTFDSGGDCIAIKAGKNRDLQYGPAQDILIQDCIMHSGHGAVTLGSEMAGAIQNVFAQNLLFENIDWESNPLDTAIRLKTNMNRGGYLCNFYVRNVTIPNGVKSTHAFYVPVPGSDVPVDPEPGAAPNNKIYACQSSSR